MGHPGRVIGIIQARLSSSRYPAKILAPVGGRPLLAHVVERLRGSGVAEWWLATSTRADDDVTAAWGEGLGLMVHRGDLNHVLSRFTSIVRERKPEWLVRVTADEPFIDAAIVDRLLSKRGSLPADVVVLGDDPNDPSFPRGYVPQLARAEPLLELDERIPAGEDYHRAHVLSWFYRNGQVAYLEGGGEVWPSRPGWRWTLDTADDHRMVQAAFRLFGKRWKTIGYAEMVAELDQHPEIVRLNQAVRQKDVTAG